MSEENNELKGKTRAVESVQKGVISNQSGTPPSLPSSFSTSDGTSVTTNSQSSSGSESNSEVNSSPKIVETD